jgi:hypothetical protein
VWTGNQEEVPQGLPRGTPCRVPALGGLNELIQRAPLVEAGQKLPDAFYWDLWANLEHLRESYIEYCAQEHFDPEASEEESVASLDNQV